MYTMDVNRQTAPSNRIRHSGFTMVELIIGMAIIVIISTVLGSVIATSLKTMDTISTRKDLITTSSTAATRFSRECKQAVNFQDASDSLFRFSYVFSTGAGPQLNTVEYVISGNHLTRQLIGSGIPQLLAQDVVADSSSFVFFDNNNNATLVLNDIHRARMNLYLTDDDHFVRFITDVYPE